MRTRIEILVLFLLLAGTSYAVRTGKDAHGGEQFASYVRHHDVHPSGLSSIGVGTPTVGCCGTICGLGLDNINEILVDVVEIGAEWDGVSNLTFHIHAVPTDGNPFATGEDVDLDFEWRSLDPTSETGKTGTVATDTVSHTQSGAGTECEIHVFVLSIPYTGGNQPVTANDDLAIKFWRDTASESSSYGGDIIIYKAELLYNANKLATH